MLSKYELVDIVAGYNPGLSEADRNRIELAYDFAREKHQGQKRDSGEEYFTHPLAIAAVCSRTYEMDVDSVIAALLHDTVEDTDTSIEMERKLFGPTVAMLVSGLTKLQYVHMKARQAAKAENYRNFVLSIAGDIRVLIIKLVDRAHNIQTLGNSAPEKRKRIAFETLNIYIPLAERIGMENLKVEMEAVCFKELYPQEAAFIDEKLEGFHRVDDDMVESVIKELSTLMAENEIHVRLFGREKTPYSIWKKMTIKNKVFDEIFDIIAFRFIANSVEDCYRILGLIHAKYKIVPARFKDYISRPKPNGYSSLHTTVIGPMGRRVEIQIRTHDMDKVAEYGFAAHWMYKEQGSDAATASFDWLRDMADSVKNASNPTDIEKSTKLTPFMESVFCFTPGGDLVTLPRGATALDFAYELHSDIGNRCSGAKVNKVMRNIHTPLKTGDEVEIITSGKQKPAPEWERLVVTTKARSHIRRYIKAQEREQTVALGRQVLRTVFDANRRTLKDQDLKPLLPKYGANNVEELYYLLGMREYTAESLLLALYPDTVLPNSKKPFDLDNFISSVKKAKETTVGVGAFADIPVSFARCCSPVPPVPISGVIHTGKGITVHARTCEQLARIEDKSRLFDLSWEDYGSVSSKFPVKISIMAENRPGALNEIISIIAQKDIFIEDIKALSKTVDYTEFLLTIEISDLTILEKVVKALHGSKIINTVLRA